MMTKIGDFFHPILLTDFQQTDLNTGRVNRNYFYNNMNNFCLKLIDLV